MLTNVVFNATPDFTGVDPAYKITNEQHTLSKNQFRDFYFIVPTFSPFFAENLTILYNDPLKNVIRPLVENIDYYCALPFVGATRAIGKPVYGSIGLNNLSLVGTLSITYQTLGGGWSFDENQLVTELAELAYNPRGTTWEVVTGAPNVFPPIPHQWELTDLVGQTEVVKALGDIETAILNNNQNAWINHASRLDNPHHVTTTLLGIPKIGNWGLATDAEMTSGSANDSLVTPLTLATKLTNYCSKDELVALVAAALASGGLTAQSTSSSAKNYFTSQF